MKPFPLFLALMLALPLAARADTRPDFDDDAKPILRMQPDLLQYVKKNFDVKGTGYSRIPGADGQRPPPPYIFRARPRGSDGPYTITLFIQPGPPDHILFVKGDQAPGASVGSGLNPAYTGEPPSSGAYPGPNPAYTGAPPPSGAYPGSNPAYTGISNSSSPQEETAPPPQPPSSAASTEMPTPANPPPTSSMEVPPAPSSPAASSSSSSSASAPPAPNFQGVTSDTPSGPIKSDSSSGSNLTPPPDNPPGQ
jgi:hypothetical protein